MESPLLEQARIGNHRYASVTNLSNQSVQLNSTEKEPVFIIHEKMLYGTITQTTGFGHKLIIHTQTSRLRYINHGIRGSVSLVPNISIGSGASVISVSPTDLRASVFARITLISSD